MKKIKVLSLFSGIGAFERGLDEANINYELINYCEIDNHASKCYSAIHGISEDLNLKDITKIEEEKLEDFDLLVHGFPCQNFSLAGKQEGGEKGSGTKSSLLWDSVRIIKHKKPKFVIWENVKNVIQGKHKKVFNEYLNELNELGYNNYYKVLNSKNYEIPQSRERIFVISIKKEFDLGFEFPNELELKFKLESFCDFREEDNITYNFLRRFKKKFGEEKTIDDFVEYVNKLPVSKGIGNKK